MMNYKLLILLLPVFLFGCAATGPADDGYDNSNEWVDNGRLLTDDKKNIYSTEKKQNGESLNSSSSEQNYTAYQQWQEARDKNSSEYQRFKQWQEYEEFQRWKEKQNAE